MFFIAAKRKFYAPLWPTVNGAFMFLPQSNHKESVPVINVAFAKQLSICSLNLQKPF